MENGRPGAMLYFNDLKPFTSFLTNEQLGVLLTAILNYAEHGLWVDDDCDPNVKVALMVLQPKIDRDGESYERKKLHGQYMTYVRMAQSNGETYLSETEWIETASAMAKAQSRLLQHDQTNSH